MHRDLALLSKIRISELAWTYEPSFFGEKSLLCPTAGDVDIGTSDLSTPIGLA
jgi:hypothetical protein